MRKNYMSILDCIIMLLIDSILYFFLAIYLDKVVPGEYGRSQSPFFCFKPSYWRRKTMNSVSHFQMASTVNDSDFEIVGTELQNQQALK